MRKINDLPDSVSNAISMTVIKPDDMRMLQRRLRHAILFRRQVHMKYLKADNSIVVRVIEPYTIFESDAGDTLVRALDVLRALQNPDDAIRSFRLDRVAALSVDYYSLRKLDHEGIRNAKSENSDRS